MIAPSTLIDNTFVLFDAGGGGDGGGGLGGGDQVQFHALGGPSVLSPEREHEANQAVAPSNTELQATLS